MQKQRDARGRFVRGHTISVGNKGNRTPKYGNQNAKKFGFHSKAYFGQKIIGDDLILIALHKGLAVRFTKSEWINHGDGFTILGEKAVYVQENLRMPLKRVKVPTTFDYPEQGQQEIEADVIRKWGKLNGWDEVIDDFYNEL